MHVKETTVGGLIHTLSPKPLRSMLFQTKIAPKIPARIESSPDESAYPAQEKLRLMLFQTKIVPMIPARIESSPDESAHPAQEN